MASDPNSADTSFYTEFRYEGTPQATIDAFSDALSLLLKRLVSDLRSTAKGRFGPESTAEYEAMAVAVERTMGHVEVFRSLASGASLPAESRGMMANIVANVLADANATGTALARANAPRAREAKFDQGKTGSEVAGLKDYAAKIKDATSAIGKLISAAGVDPAGKLIEAIGALIAAILEDIAICGAKPASNTGGNEATRQIEEKLDYVIPTVDGVKSGQDAIGGKIDEIEKEITYVRSTTDGIAKEVDDIESKANTLGRLLGTTLVGEDWDVHPHTVDKSLGTAGLGKVPKISIKDEMHGIEANIDVIVSQLNVQQTTIININVFLLKIAQFIVNIFPTQFFLFFQDTAEITTIKPPAEGTKPLIDERLKKIYVYDEGQFAAKSSTDSKTVDVTTPAFDLTGWIDLTNLRAGDIFEVGTFVTVAGQRRPLAFTKFDTAKLVPFADIARGLNYVSGSSVTIQLSQAASADAFNTAVHVGYQFVVESQ